MNKSNLIKLYKWMISQLNSIPKRPFYISQKLKWIKGNILKALGKLEEAMTQYIQAIKIN